MQFLPRRIYDDDKSSLKTFVITASSHRNVFYMLFGVALIYRLFGIPFLHSCFAKLKPFCCLYNPVT